MTHHRPDDQSLLARLNALRQTSVTLDKPAIPAQSADTLPAVEAQPVSSEDALAARLRVLRSQLSSSSRGGGGASQGGPGSRLTVVSGNGDSGTAAQPPAERAGNSEEKANRNASSPSTAGPGGSYRLFEAEAVDEHALDEFLGSLGDEHFDPASDVDLDPSSDAKKVADLLESLRNDLGESGCKQDHAPSDDGDNSEGEELARAVETILSQVTDEMNSLPPLAAVAAAAAAEKDEHHGGQEPPPRGTETEDETPVIDPNSNDDEGRDDKPHPLPLPAVPSGLADQVPDAEGEDGFEKDMAARLASLGGLGRLDALGLPSAPTFRPQDRPPATVYKGLLRSSKYTDEDQKTWCVVCLEDATVRCVGCDNDVYCSQCWKEMHVGPSAGYDERGHKWVKFERNGHA